MSPIRFFEKEHKLILGFQEIYGNWIIAHANKKPAKPAKILGLHAKKGGYAPGNFIGMVWIGEGNKRVVLQVDSKFDNPKMNYIKMYADCCAHPDVGSRMGKCFDYWPDEDYIDAEDSPDFVLLLIISFLHELNQLCARHLRKNFERRRKNFIGKVKGKILVSENLRKNIVHGRLDRVFCEYQSFSDDILENRILRAALERAARYVASSNILKENTGLQRQIHACRSHLQGVSVTHISRPQFAAARKRGIFAFYRRPLHLAKAVLLNLGFNPHEEIPQDMKTPPYAINSAKLFERYAELHLRKKHSGVCTPENISGGDDNFDIRVRPDFYVPRNGNKYPEIIDAKYKRFSKEKFHHPYNSRNGDVYQVVAYSHHKGVLKELKCLKDDDVRISLAYPSLGFVGGEPEETTSFHPDVHIKQIPCPIIGEE